MPVVVQGAVLAGYSLSDKHLANETDPKDNIQEKIEGREQVHAKSCVWSLLLSDLMMSQLSLQLWNRCNFVNPSPKNRIVQ